MMQVDKEVERLRAKGEKNKATIEHEILQRVKYYERELSSSSISMYSLDSGEEGSEFLSSHTPTVVRHDTPLPMHEEEIDSSPISKKVPFERHSTVPEENHPSSYNIEEIFGSFTFKLHRREESWKRVRKRKQVDGTLEDMQEDEVLFERTDEDPIMVNTISTTLTQATTHNISVLNEKILEIESEDVRLKDEFISLTEEIKKSRNVDDHLDMLKENILEQQEQLHDVNVE